MDRRESTPQESGFLKDLKSEEVEYDDKVEYLGKTYRVPYKMIKEVVFSNLNNNELSSIGYSARLQYRLLLMDAVLKAKVEFIRNRITVTYNPMEATNRKEKVSREQLIAFLSKEGVNVNRQSIAERDVDYFEEIYKYQFEPASIREHAPYGYTIQEWKRMKPEYLKKQAEVESNKRGKFKEWQDSYLDGHPDVAKEYGYTPKEKKVSLLDKVLGRGKSKGDKGYWFHGA